MYVIFPAEDVVELTLTRPPLQRFQHCSCQCAALQKRVSAQTYSSPTSVKRLPTPGQPSLNASVSKSNAAAAAPSPPPPLKPRSKKKDCKTTNSKSNKKEKQERRSNPKMGTNVNEPSLKDLSHPSLNEQLKAYNTATFKLVKTVSDFSQEFSRICEEHSTNLQQLVANYRKKNAELKKERPNCQSSLFYAWETLLQEVEVDSQSQGDIANVFTRQVSRPLLDRSFHRKIQARKIFGHRDSFEIIISKAEEKLMKSRQEYKAAYLAHLSSPTSSATLSNFIDAHNTYVRQLHATNGMVEQYTKDTLPALLQELEDVYSDLCITVSDSVLQGAESISSSCSDRIKRYENLTSQCRSSRPNIDIAYFVKYLSPLPPQPHSSHRLRVFMYPQPPNMDQDNVPGTSNSDFPSNAEQLAQLLPKNELVVDYMSVAEVREKHDSLKMEIVKIEAHIKQLQDALDSLLRLQQRSLETSLFNKVNELQEDISVKRYDIRISQIQLCSLRYQKELFAAKLESLEANARDRKLSAVSNASMKSKWLKAFKSLKTTGNSNGSNKETENRKNEMYHAVSTIIAMRKSGRDGFQVTNSPELIHQFQEYTYKKITPCDLCSQVLRGHTRQGLKCRLCKMNVHLDCQEKVTTKCQTKSRLLRRQKSTSEIETRIIANMPEEEAVSLPNASANHSPSSVSPSPSGRRVSWKISPGSHSKQSNSKLGYADEPITETDNTYQVIKQANEIKSMPSRITAPAEPPRKPCHPTSVSRVGQSLNVNSPPVVSNSDYGGWPNVEHRQQPTISETVRKRRLFGGVRSFTVFGGGRSQGRSISLPETPHSPRRHKINWRMKSVSLDSSEPPDFCQPKSNVVGSTASIEPHSSHSSSSRLQSPSSPIHNRRLLSAKPVRMSSVELPDDNEKSPSSASNSPIPSPMKPQRLLPTNLYAVWYNFKARHADELDLKAGYKVTVIDMSDIDWWKGKCLGKVGYFPSKYVTKLQPGERVLQVTDNLRVAAADNSDKDFFLLRDQIVIQIGEDIAGMIMFRNGDNQQGICPLEFLQEV